MQISKALMALMGVANAGYFAEMNACGNWHTLGNDNGDLVANEIMLETVEPHDGDDAARVCTSYCNDYEEATCCQALRYFDETAETYILECQAYTSSFLDPVYEDMPAQEAYGEYFYLLGMMENEGGGFTDSATQKIFSAAAILASVSLLMN